MKTLLLLRHAEAPLLANGNDNARILSLAGERMAAQRGEQLVEAGVIPQRVLCSPAIRTRQTGAALLKAFATPPEMVYEAGLYQGDAHAVLALLRQQPETLASLLILGHNPTLHQLVLGLVPPGGLKPHAALTRHFPPATLVHLAVPAWATLKQASAAMLQVWMD